ncbi:hypothetical protein [Treponema sp. Marseille-Q3903]|uniref:hypothetical protein n=1 Tax=Treponema sp. Marseille-Q3903 TaxID=2766703 RepID=UPI0016521E1F|nr:hypothetical protein [Treponema sp. Marseille-Q3903]MBC6712529.1 hypothetical protein [Treponema sp. Marseille-Q3903]
MKKMSLAIVMLLALGLAFTSCKQPGTQDADLTAEDLNDTSWMIGTWEEKSENDYNISGISDVLKKEVEKRVPSAPAPTELTVTKDNVDEFATKLKGYIAIAGKPQPIPGKTETYTINIKINKDKTKISIYNETETKMDFMGNKVSVKITKATIYTKK